MHPKQAASEQLEYHMFMGLFPQIHRAWMTIDHMLFLWDYTDPRGSFYQYDGLDQTIIHATLVKPRPSVFAGSSTPQWLLVADSQRFANTGERFFEELRRGAALPEALPGWSDATIKGLVTEARGAQRRVLVWS